MTKIYILHKLISPNTFLKSRKLRLKNCVKFSPYQINFVTVFVLLKFGKIPKIGKFQKLD
jgi:hypothetical protein